MNYTSGAGAPKTRVWVLGLFFFVGAVLELPSEDVVWYLQEGDGLILLGTLVHQQREEVSWQGLLD